MVSGKIMGDGNNCFSMTLFNDEVCNGANCAAKSSGAWEYGVDGASKMQFNSGNHIALNGSNYSAPSEWNNVKITVDVDGTAHFILTEH